MKKGLVFSTFPLRIPLLPLQKDLTVSCMGGALQTVIPKMIHKKITAFFELIKPLVEFKVNHVVLFVLIPVLTF